MRPPRLRNAAITFCAVLLLRQSPVLAQTDVHSLLDQVSSAVRARYLGGYLVSIDRRQRADPHYGFALGGSMRDEPPAPVIHSKNDGSHDVITLARLGNRLRYNLRNSADQRWQWLTDGQTLWSYRQDIGLYTEESAEPWPQPLGPAPGLPGVEWKYVAKFLALSGMADRARIVTDDLTPTAACSGPSVLLELILPEGKEELRVLSNSHLPCETTIRRTVSSQRVMRSEIDETVVWKFASDPPAASLFVFAPRRGAKRVKRLPRVE